MSVRNEEEFRIPNSDEAFNLMLCKISRLAAAAAVAAAGPIRLISSEKNGTNTSERVVQRT